MSKSRKEEIQQNSQEWNETLYHLQLMSGQPLLKIINLYKYSQTVSNRSQISQFDSLVDITDFKHQYKEKVFKKVIPLQDVVFFCGHINIQPGAPISKIYTYLICKLRLGRIGTFQNAQDPTDSIYIQSETQNQPFHYSFLVKSHSQYQVKYQVSFKIGDQQEFLNTQIKCGICQKQPATIYCVQQKMYFCDDCGRNHHIQPINSKPKLKHQLQKLNRINTLPLCQNHSTKNEFYCLKCQKYVCSVCCQKGSHSQNRQHPVRPIQFLYEQKRQNNTILPVKPQQKLQKLIMSASNRSLQIQANYEAVKGKLIRQFEKALKKLEELFKDKLIRVQSDEIELNMINHKIEWAKAFVNIQQKQLKPVYYFKLQTRFQQYLRSLTINNYESSFIIQPDLDAQADIVVGSQQEMQNCKRFAKNDPQNIQKQESNKLSKSSLISKRQHSMLVFDPKRQPPSKGELILLLQNSNLTFFKGTSKCIQLLLPKKSTSKIDDIQIQLQHTDYFIQLMNINNLPYAQSMQNNHASKYTNNLSQQSFQSFPSIYHTIKKRILSRKQKFYTSIHPQLGLQNTAGTQSNQGSLSLQQSEITKKLSNVKVQDFDQKNIKKNKPQKHRYIIFQQPQDSSQANKKQLLNIRSKDNESKHKVKFNNANLVASHQIPKIFSSDKCYMRSKPTSISKQTKLVNKIIKNPRNQKFTKYQTKMLLREQSEHYTSNESPGHNLIKNHYTPISLTKKINKSLQKQLPRRNDLKINTQQGQSLKKISYAQTQFSRRLKPVKQKSVDIYSNQESKYTVPTKKQYRQYLENYQSISSAFNLQKLIYKDTFKIIPNQQSVYFGEVSGQVKEGKAVLVTQHSIFQGVYQNNQKLKGCQKNIDGIYTGFFKDGLREGVGKFQWNNGQIYQGSWKLGKKHGKGIWVSPDGDTYEGLWLNGRQHGKGLHKHKNSTYQGQFLNGLKHGNGEQNFSNGDKYKGFYQNGKPHGHGRYDWADGSYYEGQFIQGYRQGKGVLKEANGTYYKVKALLSVILNTGLGWKSKDMDRNSRGNSSTDRVFIREYQKIELDVALISTIYKILYQIINIHITKTINYNQRTATNYILKTPKKHTKPQPSGYICTERSHQQHFVYQTLTNNYPKSIKQKIF